MSPCSKLMDTFDCRAAAGLEAAAIRVEHERPAALDLQSMCLYLFILYV